MKKFILDVDGTLWDTTEVVARAWNEAIRVTGGTSAVITASILKKEFGKPMDVIANNLFHDADEKQREILLQACIHYEHEYLEQCTDDLLYPGVRETIQALAANAPVFIVSNCQSGYIELFMSKAGVEPYITDFECFGNTGRSKGENIKLIMERNNLGDEAIYVGDTQGDYEATVQAGVPFVYARYGFGTVERCDWAIDEISELLEIGGLS